MTNATAKRETTLPSPGNSWDTRIAVLIPCFNEEATVGAVVTDFRRALPSADIYVYDNNSGDGTIAAARLAGAIIRSEASRGKGNVVRRMFADIEADIYILVDGDGTYDAAAAPALALHLVEQRLDLVNACRVSGGKDTARFGHRTGNAVLTWIVAKVFGNRFADMLSGYKVLSRRFVKSFPITASTGFEIETELTVHALELNLPAGELPASYKERPAGSNSKLRTFRDGIRIIWTIFVLIKEERPLAFFAGISALLMATSLILVAPVVVTFLETGLVPRLPTAVLATGEMLLGFLSLACGLILDTVTRGRKEMKQLHYLLLAAVLAEDR